MPIERLILDGLILAGLLLTSAFLAGAEAAYFSLSRLGTTHLEPSESPAHARLARLLADPHGLLITLLVGITLVNIGASALATEVATTLFGARGVVIAIPLMVFLIVVFGEVLPMTLAVGAPHRFGILAAPLTLALRWLVTPVRTVLGSFTAAVERAVGREGAGTGAISEAELRTLVEVGHQEGVVERAEREMIHGVFELGDTTVGDVMTPRADVVGIDATIGPARLLEAIRTQPRPRYPVYEGSLDNIVGMLTTRALLPYYAGLPPGFDLRTFLSPPYFVPETKRADALLREFQAKHLQAAVVVDEYGGTAGLVTLDDILEEVVGEIGDDFAPEEPLAHQVDDRTWRVAAKMPIGDFNALTGLRVPDEHFDTVGGWVLDLFGRLPHRNETIEAAGVKVTVEKVHRTRILEVLVHLAVPGPTPAPETTG
jgi:putative hemolysin